MSNERVTKNLLIRASAGTGKTFAIATHFIWLFIVREIDASNILALTFSRLAAQEIYTKILERLWKAAYRDETQTRDEDKESGARAEKQTLLEMIFGENSSPSESEVAMALNGHPLDAAEFSRALRKLVATQHLGTIATLDSFLLKFVRSYPLELGFQNKVTLVDDYEKKTSAKDATKQLLAHGSHRDFIVDVFHSLETSWRRSVRTRLDWFASSDWRRFVRQYGVASANELKEVFEIPKDLEPFAKEENAFAEVNLNVIIANAVSSKTGKATKTASGAVITGFQKLTEALSGYSGDTFLSFETTFLKALLEALRLPYKNEILFFGANETRIPRDEFLLLAKILKRADLLYLAKSCEKASKRLSLAALFENECEAKMRRAGLLVFDDLPDAQKTFGDSMNLENLYYRFDSRCDHWALDEFQDMSDAQWNCLRPLVENAANDDTKSVVAVGDLKQSIYGWRGGSESPFLDLMNWRAMSGRDELGNELPPIVGSMRIGEIQDKDISRRYEKNICDFINRIFCRDNLFLAIGGTRPSAVASWCDENCWRVHEALRDKKTGEVKAGDYVKVIAVPVDLTKKTDEEEFTRDEDDENDDISAKGVKFIAKALVREIATLWQSHRESHSRETVGVLVRGNDEGAAIAKILRRAGLPAIWEGLVGARDVPIVELLLAILTLGEHPEDTAAWGFVIASPLSRWLKDVLATDAFESAEKLSRVVATRLSQEGLSRTLNQFIQPIRADLLAMGDNEGVSYLSGLLRAAVRFELVARPGDGIDAFKEFVTNHRDRTLSASADFIRILTIHRSKGLGMDHVFVPIADTSRTNLVTSAGRLTVCGEASRPWIFADVTEKSKEAHPLLREAWLMKNERMTSENLHTYYVALTRAKKSMTVIMPNFIKCEKGFWFHKNNGFASVILGALWGYSGVLLNEEVMEFGTAVKCHAPKKEVSKIPSVSPIGFRDFEGDEEISRSRISPSKLGLESLSRGHFIASSRNVFSSDATRDTDLGRDIHAELSRIEWLEVATNDFERALLKPEENAIVWREKAYEIYSEGGWESGVIDRVVFYRENGVKKAMVSDFKVTRDLDDSRLRERYREQLLSYRRAVAKIAKIEETNVAMQLLVQSPDGSSSRVLAITASA